MIIIFVIEGIMIIFYKGKHDPPYTKKNYDN